MKSNAPSPRFLYEFDTVDTLALRNISEKRKLRRKLGELDKQLHNNLVRMESEILSIRLENCESSPATLQRKAKDKESKSNSIKGKIKTKLKERSHQDPKSLSQNVETDLVNFEDVINPNKAAQNLSAHNVLPKITTSSYLTAKPEVEKNERELLSESVSLETISEFGQKQLQAEQRVLMSLERPRSKPKLKAGALGRPATPQASNQLLSPLKPLDRQRRASSYNQLAPLPDGYLSKGSRTIRAFSAPDFSDSLSMSEVGRLRSLANRQNQIPGEINGPGTVANGIKICVTDANGSPKPKRATKFLLDPVKPRGAGNAESKSTNFDEVLQSRLQLLEKGVPKREDLEKIRYLRLKGETRENTDAEDIFAALHYNKSG